MIPRLVYVVCLTSRMLVNVWRSGVGSVSSYGKHHYDVRNNDKRNTASAPVETILLSTSKNPIYINAIS